MPVKRILYLAQLEKPRPRNNAVTIGDYRFVPNQITEVDSEKWVELEKEVAIAQRLEWGALKVMDESSSPPEIPPETPPETPSSTTAKKR